MSFNLKRRFKLKRTAGCVNKINPSLSAAVNQLNYDKIVWQEEGGEPDVGKTLRCFGRATGIHGAAKRVLCVITALVGAVSIHCGKP